jgi:hypothetical protein
LVDDLQWPWRLDQLLSHSRKALRAISEEGIEHLLETEAQQAGRETFYQ